LKSSKIHNTKKNTGNTKTKKSFTYSTPDLRRGTYRRTPKNSVDPMGVDQAMYSFNLIWTNNPSHQYYSQQKKPIHCQDWNGKILLWYH